MSAYAYQRDVSVVESCPLFRIEEAVVAILEREGLPMTVVHVRLSGRFAASIYFIIAPCAGGQRLNCLSIPADGIRSKPPASVSTSAYFPVSCRPSTTVCYHEAAD